MAYVGNPIDTQNTFQSLVGKRFNGDGSTTAFTLDVAPSSTLDLEVFVGNVRQDPNSAYTVSGTTLTFTGAPPSGTNNIYVVHQAKSVGTITPGANSVGVTELNLSDGSNGQFISTNGSGTLSFASVASLAGIDDQSSSNDDQLTITDTAVVVNEDSDDVDFRVESNGNANMLFVSGGNDVVGIGAEGDLGVGLHIKSADTSATVSSEADELVIEHGSSIGGMSILGATDGLSKIAFGDSDNNDAGIIHYSHDNTTMAFTTEGTERMSINGSGVVKVNTRMFIDGDFTTTGATFKLKAEFGGSSAEAGISINDKDAATNSPHFVQFRRSGTIIGSISRNGSNDAVNFNTSSDYRLKDGIVDKTDGIEKIKLLKPRKFYWKTNTDKTLVDGFIAHEVSDIVPEVISGTKDAVDEDDNIIPQAIDQSKLVPLLTAALQEAITKIEALEARVTTLEG
jgi:hypothetical protein